jgi:hypothetical protein
MTKDTAASQKSCGGGFTSPVAYGVRLYRYAVRQADSQRQADYKLSSVALIGDTTQKRSVPVIRSPACSLARKLLIIKVCGGRQGFEPSI